MTGGSDGTVRVWDVATGRELLVIKEELGEVKSVAYARGGMRIAAGFASGAIRVYAADPWWDPGHEPKRPEPVKLEITPVPEARPGTQEE